MFDLLFTPASINGMTVKNRIISAPCERNYANVDGSVTQRYIDYLVERAKGGVGLIIVEAVYIDPVGKNHIAQLGIHDDALIPGYRRLAEAVHEFGAKIGIEINHGGRQSSSLYTGFQPVAPSPVPCGTLALGDLPRELTIREIEDLIEKFVQAAVRAKKAGLDMIEIHGAHGYLIGQFLSPFSNKRTDAYGGTPEKRMRFPLEVVRRIRDAVGSDFPIAYRLSADEHVDGGLTFNDTAEFCKHLEKAGVDLIDVSAGIYESVIWVAQPMAFEPGCLVPLSREIKKAVGISVSVAGRINDPELAERILEAGDADFVSLGRALHADPFFPEKAMQGRVEEIRRCPACMSCSDELGTQLPISCAINPAAGNEREFALVPAAQKKSVAVIGAGPAGLTAAWVAATKGHKVTLYEKNDSFGGQLLYAKAPSHKRELKVVIDYLVRQAEKSGAEIRLKQEITADDIVSMSVDAIVLATGALPIIPPIPGLDTGDVCTALDVLAGRIDLGSNRRVVVIGGGLVGCETALFMIERGVDDIVIVEPGPAIARNMGLREGWYLREAIEKDRRIKVELRTTVERVEGEELVLQSQGSLKTIRAQNVVLAVGMRSNNSLAEAVLARVKANHTRIKQVGDCVLPRKMKDAIREGFMAGNSI